METLRQIISVGRDRKLTVDLPETLDPGLVEVILVVQPLSPEQSQSPQAIRLHKLLECCLNELIRLNFRSN